MVDTLADRTLPWWLRLEFAISTTGRVVFGFTLLFVPSMIDQLWPWHLSPLITRLLGASTLVSVPMALLVIYFNRTSAARIALIIEVTYRIMTLVAGFMHFDKIGFQSPVAINYFVGGLIRLVVEAAALVWASRFGKPADAGHAWLRGEKKLAVPPAMKTVFMIIGGLFVITGIYFLIAGAGAGWMWMEAGLTGLTARLFASPMLGLGFALILIGWKAQQWREVAIPAVGMATFGFAGSLSMLLEMSSIQPPTPMGYILPFSPVILLLLGATLLLPASSEK
jgi:hypothetical protein